MSFKLKKKRIRNDRSIWIRAEHAFPAIVEPPLFEAAQTIIHDRSSRLSDEEMLSLLRRLHERHDGLSGLIIDEAEGMPSSSSYRSRFGSLLRAYSLVGYRPRRDYRYIEINRQLRRLHPEILAEVESGFGMYRAEVAQNADNDLLTINAEFSVSVVIARCRRTPAGALRWRLRFDVSLRPDITAVVRMDAANRRPLDYYLFPDIDRLSAKVRLAEDNPFAFDAYRFESLEVLYRLGERVQISEAA